MKYILCIDQGTTSTRAILYDQKANVVAKAQREIKQIYPFAGWVEHDPQDIYDSVVITAKEAAQSVRANAEDIQGIAITNQRETTVVWDKLTGEPIYNAIVWQCRRTAEFCESLKKEYGEVIYDKTGLKTDAYFSASKVKWILDNVPDARVRAEKGELLFGTVDTYIVWRLTGGSFVTDYTNASRTMLYNIHELAWDKELLKIFDIPSCMLPKVLPSGSVFGMADSIPILAVCGDQQASLFGHLCTESGMLKTTYGTGCFMLMNTGEKAVKSKYGLITTLTASLDKPQYALEGSVFMGGATIQWLRDGLGIIDCAAETESIALSVDDSDGVYLVPAFTGLGAPYWDGRARGAILGLTRGSVKAHIVRAALEGIAFQVNDIAKSMESDMGKDITLFEVDGGACENNFLMQFQSDILNAEVARPSDLEVTTLGVYYLAALKCGIFGSIEEIRQNAKKHDKFIPTMPLQKRERLLAGWKTAVGRIGR